jgi:phosphoribosylformimino-5-aminoimidazole carboxamide ribotide isomerase
MASNENQFTIFPAIDLLGGKVVRLRQGDPQQVTIYSADPEAVARRWLDAGIRWLHVVNLDGAFGEEDSANRLALKTLLKTAEKYGASIQYGGGLRNISTIEAFIDEGVSRVILGTFILKNIDSIDLLLAKFGVNKLAAGIDARHGWVQVHGWRTGTQILATDLGIELNARGFHLAIFTDINRDGVGSGINIAATERFAATTGLAVIASGGVNGAADLQAARQAGLSGIIVGRALYDGRVTIKDCI